MIQSNDEKKREKETNIRKDRLIDLHFTKHHVVKIEIYNNQAGIQGRGRGRSVGGAAPRLRKRK